MTSGTPPHRLRRRLAAATSSTARVGMAGAVLCFVVLSTAHLLTVPPYWPIDELSNVAYARAVATGDLPTVHDPIPRHEALNFDERMAFERARDSTGRLDIWTSNHPPLYFVLAGIPLRLGDAVGAPTLGLLAARGVSLVAGALGVWLVGLLTLELAPRRPHLAVLASGLAALTPSLVHVSSLVLNDSLAFALATLGLLAAVRWQRRGRRSWLTVATAAAGAVALTRATGLVATAAVVCLCGVGGWRRASRARAAGPVRAGLIAGVGSAVVAAWPYVRNLRRYGDLTGATVLLEKFDREPNGAVTEILTSAAFWWNQVDRLLNDFSAGWWVRGRHVLVGRTLVVAVAIGLVLAVVRARRRRVPPSAERRLTLAVLTALPVGLALLVVVFHSRGGTPHARYLLSGLAVLALAGAVGLAALPGGDRRIPGVAALVALLALNVGLLVRFQVADPDDRYGAQFVLRGVELPVQPAWVIAAGIGVVVGVVLIARGLLAGDGRSAAEAAPVRPQPAASR